MLQVNHLVRIVKRFVLLQVDNLVSMCNNYQQGTFIDYLRHAKLDSFEEG